MAVIADFAAYPEWATGVRTTEIIDQGADGRASRVRFTLDAGPIKDRFVLRYLLAERGGATDVTYDLTVGVRIPMIGMVKRRVEKSIIDTALKGLKKRAEDGEGATT